MKITDGLQGLYKPDLFNNQNPKVQQKADQTEELTSIAAKQSKTLDNSFALKKVLSVKEINSLNALFGFEQGTQNALYGNNKMRNIHAGMLLDVKG
ncbi:MAG: hypothetical protein H6627_11765 [Calditrichae bacterium]|nr:hypothetical protein [Calditrichota bacterium]MCB9059236.1 hypothetical protein [Calditrichia bacterium]